MNKMKNMLYRLAALLPLFTFASSCDVLDQEPQSMIVVDEFYTSGADAEIGLIGAYNRLFREPHIPDLWMKLDINSDDLTTRAAGVYGYAWENRSLMSPTQDANTAGAFTAPYVTIANANLLIERIAEVPEGSFVGPTVAANSNRKKEILGEAHFIRAVSYYYLAMLWGDVPLILEFPKGALPEQNSVPTSPQQEVLAQVVKDLQIAEANLPNALTQFNANERRGRASKWAAKAYLSRIRLWEKNWQEALKLSNEIINSGQYNLVNPWTRIFLQEANSQEAILEIQTERGPSFFNMGLQGWFYGNGEFRATQQALEQFRTVEEPPTGVLKDVRVEHSIRYNENAANNLRVYKNMPQPLWADAGIARLNLTVVRLAEIYFNKAEALNELNYAGNRQEVLDILNIMRARAKQENFEHRFRPTAPNSTIGIPPLTLADVPTQEAMRQAIRNEKRRELMFEGTRWIDLLRWDPQYAMQIVGAANPNQLYFPIPETEIIRNNGVLVQNPGWQ